MNREPVNNRHDTYNVGTVLSKVTFEAIAADIGHQMQHAVLGLRADLAGYTHTYPDAAIELEQLMTTWITEAEDALVTFREFNRVPLIDTAKEVERTKRRYWAELQLIKKAYADEDIASKYAAMCAYLDGPYTAHYLHHAAQQRLEYQAYADSAALRDS